MKITRTSPSGLLAIAGTAAFCALSVIHSQELSASLQPLAEKHKSDLAALDATRDGAVGRARETYVTALNAAETPRSMRASFQ